MKLTTQHLIELCELAQLAAKEAGALIQKHLKDNQSIQQKDGGDTLASQVVTATDFASQEIILNHLKPTLSKYDLGLLSEELQDDNSRLEKDYHWCVDPLDGTLPFTEKKTGYAVSIALLDSMGAPQIGVVFDPSNDNLYSAIKGQGAFKNGKGLVPSTIEPDTLTFVTDRSFLNHSQFGEVNQFISKLANQRGLQTKTISHGGAVMNALWLLDHEPAVYFKFPKSALGGGSAWDYAATACIFEALDLRPTDCFGKNLNLAHPKTTFMNRGGVVYATGLPMHQEIIGYYGSHVKDEHHLLS